MKEAIISEKAPAAIGPYSQAIKTGNLIFCSGQLPIDRATGEMSEGIKEQTRRSLENVKHILAEEGLGIDNVVKTTVLLADMSLFAEMNEVYGETFSQPFPARSAFAVKALPMGALVEIEVIATLS